MKVETQTYLKVISLISSAVLMYYIISQSFDTRDEVKDIMSKIASFDGSELSRLHEAMGLGDKENYTMKNEKEGQGYNADEVDKSVGVNSQRHTDTVNIVSKREDRKEEKRADKKDKEDKKDKKSKPFKPLENPGIRFAIAFGAILLINFAAITVHHIYMKLSSSHKSYRTVEHTLSPY